MDFNTSLNDSLGSSKIESSEISPLNDKEAKETGKRLVAEMFLSLFPELYAPKSEEERIFTNIASQMAKKNSPQKRAEVIDKAVKDVSPYYFGPLSSESFAFRFSAFLEAFFAKDDKSLLDAVQKVYHNVIEDDGTSSVPDSDPLLEVVFTDQNEKVKEVLVKLPLAQRDFLSPLIYSLCDRALNGKRSDFTVSSFINQVMHSEISKKFEIINVAMSIFTELLNGRTALLDEYREVEDGLSKRRDMHSSKLLKDYEDLIKQEKVDTFLRKENPIRYADLEQIEKGKFLKPLLSTIKPLLGEGQHRAAILTIVKVSLEKAANGDANKSPLEELILGIKKLPITLAPVDYISSTESEEVHTEKEAFLHIIKAYLNIKEHRDFIAELRLRQESHQGISRRWVSHLQQIKKPDEAHEKLPQWVKVKNYIQRYYSRISPVPAEMATNIGLGRSPHQTIPGYYQSDVGNIAGKHNQLWNNARRQLVSQMEQGEKLDENEVYILNSSNITKTLESNFEYLDLTHLDENQMRENIRNLVIAIKEKKRKLPQQDCMIGFKIKAGLDELPKKTGERVLEKSALVRKILNEEVESIASGEELEGYYSLITFSVIVDRESMPFMFIPKIWNGVTGNNYWKGHFDSLAFTISGQGYFPPMQKTMQFMSSHTSLAEIRSSGIGNSSIQPQTELCVDSFTSLIEHPIFKKFKEISESDKAKQAGVDLMMQSTVKVVEKFDQKVLEEHFNTDESQVILRRSFGLILSAMQKAISFSLGFPSDVVDLSNIKEHVIEQVLMWLDNPLPSPKNDEEAAQNRSILVKKRERLEKAMEKAHFEDLKPNFSQFVSSGGMDAFTTIVQNLMDLKGGKPLQTSVVENSYFLNKKVLEKTNKTENIFIIKQDTTKKDIEAMIATLKANHQQLDLIIVDPHPSPNENLFVEKENSIEAIIEMMMKSEVISDIFTIKMDVTASPLHSEKLIKMIQRSIERFPTLNIIVDKSCQKFDNWNTDKLTGGFFALFSNNKKVVEAFERSRKDKPIDQFNVEGFTYFFENFPNELDLYAKRIISNANHCWETIKRIDSEAIYDSQTSLETPFFDRREDPDCYFIVLNLPKHWRMQIINISQEFHDFFLRQGISTLHRLSLGYEISNYDGIGDYKIRIKPGDGTQTQMKQLGEALVRFRKELPSIYTRATRVLR